MPPTSLRELAARYSPAQRRTVEVALGLFAEHGVGGTSFQMIADALGVTKAAVYHQFQTKDAIVLAVVEVQLQPVEAIVTGIAEQEPDPAEREHLLDALVDFVVDNRHSLSTLQRDPVLFRLLSEYPPSLTLWTRVFDILLDGESGDASPVLSAVLSAAIGTVAYPFVIDLDNDVLRAELRRILRRLVFDGAPSDVTPRKSMGEPPRGQGVADAVREAMGRADRQAYQRHPEHPDSFWDHAEAWGEE